MSNRTLQLFPFFLVQVLPCPARSTPAPMRSPCKIKIHYSCEIELFCRNSYLQAVCDAPIARITGCVSSLSTYYGSDKYTINIILLIPTTSLYYIALFLPGDYEYVMYVWYFYDYLVAGRCCFYGATRIFHCNIWRIKGLMILECIVEVSGWCVLFFSSFMPFIILALVYMISFALPPSSSNSDPRSRSCSCILL